MSDVRYIAGFEVGAGYFFTIVIYGDFRVGENGLNGVDNADLDSEFVEILVRNFEQPLCSDKLMGLLRRYLPGDSIQVDTAKVGLGARH